MTSITVEGEGALADDLRTLMVGQEVSSDNAAAKGTALIADADVTATCARIRRCLAPAIVVIVPESLPALARHLVTSAITPLAIELAPARRVSAVVMHNGASQSDVAQAALFLITAQAVTGQTLEIEGPSATRDDVASASVAPAQ